jgi:dienelactone hydrolase
MTRTATFGAGRTGRGLGWACTVFKAVTAFATFAALGLATAQTPAPEAAPAAAELPPPSLFFERPDIGEAKLSPSGRWLALASRAGSPRTGLVIFDLQAWKPLGVAARMRDADISQFHWVNDEVLVFSVTDSQAGSGDQRFGAGLFSVNRNGQGLRELIRTQWEQEASSGRLPSRALSPRHSLLHVPPGGGEEVIVGEDLYTEAGQPQGTLAKRLNVLTGRTTNLSQGLPPHVQVWWFEPDGQPRAVMTRHEGRSRFFWRDAGQAQWRQLMDAPSYELPWAPRFVDASGALWITRSAGPESRGQLRRFNFQTGAPETTPVLDTPGFDFTGSLVTEGDGGQALGLRVITDAQTTVWFDAGMAAVQAEIDERLPGLINRLSCRPCSGPEMTVLVRSFSDRHPGQIGVYWPAQKRWRALGAVRPRVDPARMATTDFHRIKARDGLEFPVWVTRPAGAQGALPAVVLVHGGPWVRGRHWEWDDYPQFLASRGYVVIEPEYRGSTGYGQRLYRAGWKQFGQAMQDDIADALLWAVKSGQVDGRRVCIAGASHGGYSTLMGLIRHPELYRCGAAWVAPSDPRVRYDWRFDSDLDDESRLYSLPLLVGERVKDAAMFDAISPVLHADKIRAPLLLVYGGEDRRVPIVHGERMRDALRKAGREHEYWVYLDEGHSWVRLENRVDFALRLERFLALRLK